MGRKKKRNVVDTAGGDGLSHNPFGALGERFGIEPSAEPSRKEPRAEPADHTDDQPMLLIRKEKRKGGKAVTCIYHLRVDHKAWLKKMKQRFATGGSVDDGVLALQGDFREDAKAWLETEGFTCRLGN